MRRRPGLQCSLSAMWAALQALVECCELTVLHGTYRRFRSPCSSGCALYAVRLDFHCYASLDARTRVSNQRKASKTVYLNIEIKHEKSELRVAGPCQ